jgi:hypothetical protein
MQWPGHAATNVLKRVNVIKLEHRHYQSRQEVLHVEETTLEGDHDRVGTITGVEFRENALEMPLDGVLGDAEMFSDDLVGTATGNTTECFQLSAGERIVGNVLGHFYGDFLGDAPVPRVH